MNLVRTSRFQENEMLQIKLPSRSDDPEGWDQGRRDRRKYYANCLELKGFKREFFTGKALKDQKIKEKRRMTNEELIKKPRFQIVSTGMCFDHRKPKHFLNLSIQKLGLLNL